MSYTGFFLLTDFLFNIWRIIFVRLLFHNWLENECARSALKNKSMEISNYRVDTQKWVDIDVT